MRLTDITNAMIYGITALAGFEAAAALGEEAKNTRRSVPASTIWIVIVTVLTGRGFVTEAVNAAIRILFAMGRERVLPAPLARLSGRRTPAIAIGCLAAYS